jgi:hypothetical protein
LLEAEINFVFRLQWSTGECSLVEAEPFGGLIAPPHATKHPKPRVPHQQRLYHVLEVYGDASPAASTCDN